MGPWDNLFLKPHTTLQKHHSIFQTMCKKGHPPYQTSTIPVCVWWMSFVIDVRCGQCLVWSMSSVGNVLFYTQCGECLVQWMSVWWMLYNRLLDNWKFSWMILKMGKCNKLESKRWEKLAIIQFPQLSLLSNYSIKIFSPCQNCLPKLFSASR